MSQDPGHPPRDRPTAARFTTTRWSLVLSAGKPETEESAAALKELCETYWYPLYAYIRRQGHRADEAQDLTQAFFSRFLKKNYLELVKPERGKFRSYLLGALQHFLKNERDQARAAKRGGGRPPVSLDLENAEDRYRLEPSHDLTAEKIFERRWALALLDRVLGRLREELERTGKGNLFQALKCFLGGEEGRLPYAQSARELHMTEGAVKVAVHRLRRRYRDLLREEIAQTVAEPEDIDDEIRYLFAVLGS